MNQKTYSINEQLLQAIVNQLNQQPAGATRGLLNAIEQTCFEQDKSAADKAAADQREAIKAELADEAEKAVPATGPAPAP